MSTFGKTPEEQSAILQKPFGGIHVLFSGDLYQLAPVHGRSIYHDNFEEHTLNYQGRQLWKKIKSVHFLNENIRVKVANDRLANLIENSSDEKDIKVRKHDTCR